MARALDELSLGLRHHTAGAEPVVFHRPGGNAIPAAAPTPAGNAARMVEENLNAGVAPTADSLIPDWDGTRQDMDAAVGFLYEVSVEDAGPGSDGSSRPRRT